MFLEEERERELEEMYTNSANPRGDRDDMRVVSTANGEEAAVEESTEVSKSTTETLMAGERIMEALEISEVDRAAKKAYEEETKRLPEELAKRVPPPSRNPIFSMYNNCQAEEYVLKVVRSIPAAGLQDALLVLPFGKVIQLIEHLDYWAQRVSFFGRNPMVSQPRSPASIVRAGMVSAAHVSRPLLPTPNPPLATRRNPNSPPDNGPTSRPPPRCAQATKGER